MLMLVSPAKTLDFDRPIPRMRPTEPAFLDMAEPLVQALRGHSAADLSQLMKISPALGELNARRFAEWERTPGGGDARAAIYAFRGEVYQGLAADSLARADIQWAQRHLRILSGLYGLLRPLDRIQPYRLEMGTRFGIGSARNLHEYWRDGLTGALNVELADQRQPVLLNLASQEYFGAVATARIKGRVITANFKELRDGRYQFMSAYGKRARGLMARYVIENRIKAPEAIQAFNVDGYRFEPGQSTENDWVFARGE